VQLYTNTAGSGVRKVHHKLMAIDERLTIVGSFTYTALAATFNDENIIVLGDLQETTAPAETAQRTIAAYALTEITRMTDNLCQPV
jgi:phosphatidylserine/phosphatidylglycerophosphate/cardiolipin synthase-like enzyme